MKTSGNGSAGDAVRWLAILLAIIVDGETLRLAAASAADRGPDEPFLIQVQEGGRERTVERWQKVFLISLPFSVAYSYGLYYLAVAAEQHDRTPDLTRPRDYKPYILGTAVGFSCGIAFYDWWRGRRVKPEAQRN